MKANKTNYKPRKETKDCKNKRIIYIQIQYKLDQTIKEINNKKKP